MRPSTTAADQVFPRIVGLAIPPGTVLDRPRLSGYCQLLPSPIRAALLRLEEDKLVDVFPQHRTCVRGIDLASPDDAA